MKSYTDLEQSKKLAEFLPLESADMVYIKHSSSDNPAWEFNEDFPPMILGNVPIDIITVETLPCWSLTALLNIAYMVVGRVVDSDIWICSSYKLNLSLYADNPIDACYMMILRLHEQELL